VNVVLSLGQILISVALIAAILLQARGTGLSGTFGGDSAVYRSRRGVERRLWQFTIVLMVLFILFPVVGFAAITIEGPRAHWHPRSQPAGNTSHSPEHHRPPGLNIAGGHQHKEARGGAEEGAQGHAAQQQMLRRGAPPRHHHHGPGGEKGPDDGGQRHGEQADGAAAQGDGRHGPEGPAAADPQESRARQGVAEVGLHHGPRGAQSRAHGQSHQGAGQADIPEHRAGQLVAPAEQRRQDLPGRQQCIPQGQGGQGRQGGEAEEQKDGARDPGLHWKRSGCRARASHS